MQDITKILNNLDKLLINSYSKIPSHKKLGVLFSGGVDSSTIAKYAQDCGLNPILFTFGTDFSKDKDYAQRLAQDLQLPFHYLHLNESTHNLTVGVSSFVAQRQGSIHPLTNVSGIVRQNKETIETALPKVKELLIGARIDPNLMQISLSLGFYLISQEAEKLGVDLFLSGQGSDELFGGYNKYLTVNRKQLTEKMRNDTKNLFKIDVVRDRVMTKQSGVDIYFPYLDGKFIKFVQSLPLDLKIHTSVTKNTIVRKWILRELAKLKGLPDYIFNRPKNALQYSSGVQKLVEKILKKTPRPDK